MRFRHWTARAVWGTLGVWVALACAGLTYAGFPAGPERVAGWLLSPALGASLYAMAGRSRVEAADDGVTVRNPGGTRVLAWGEIDSFRLEADPLHPRRPPRAFALLRSGERVPMVAIEGTHVITSGFREWAWRSVDTLNELHAISRRR